jgi:sugar porter (SP) family MFS transporter
MDQIRDLAGAGNQESRVAAMTVPVQISGSVAEHGDFSQGSAYLWLAAAAGALGGLLFGYDWVVIGGAKPFYEIYFHLASPELQGWAMSCALVGCLAGAVAAGGLSDRFGRRHLLTSSALLFAASSLGTALATHFFAFVLWRILGGLAIGLASAVAPMFIAEISPAHLRGRLVSLNQLAIVVGILLAQAVNWFVARPVAAGSTAAEIFASWNGQSGWRWMFGLTAVPAILFLVATFFLPESPRWLAIKGRNQQALDVLRRLSSESYARQVLNEFRQAGGEQGNSSLLRELDHPGFVRAFVLGLVLAVLQQWCGINVIFNYAQEIFAGAGYQISGILFNIVITGTVNLVFTVVAIAAIDRFGRRLLLLLGTAGLTGIYLLLGVFYRFHIHGVVMLGLVLAAIACYSLSLAPVTWVVISEIFPNRIRAEAVSVAVTALWIACFILTYTFPLLNASISTAGVFFLYAIICLTGLVYLSLRLPETRNRSLEEIESIFQKRKVTTT